MSRYMQREGVLCEVVIARLTRDDMKVLLSTLVDALQQDEEDLMIRLMDRADGPKTADVSIGGNSGVTVPVKHHVASIGWEEV